MSYDQGGLIPEAPVPNLARCAYLPTKRGVMGCPSAPDHPLMLTCPCGYKSETARAVIAEAIEEAMSEGRVYLYELAAPDAATDRTGAE